jgi:hypothetical protein
LIKSPKIITDVRDANVLCDATVDLISKVQRPYLFRVRVTGKPPHASVREYDIAAKTEDDAAMKGIEVFVEQMTNPIILVEVPH